MIENKDQQQRKDESGVLGRLVDESGELKEPSHCIIQYGGRVRLPDKLMEILNKDFEPDTMWWQPDGECFAFDSETVQKKILDVWFRGTKLTSFIRSLNRWGFRRVFYHALPESALAFHHAAFRKTSTPEMLKSMKMSKSGKAAAAVAVAAAAAKPEQPRTAETTSLHASLYRQTLESPMMAVGNTRLSTLSQLAAAAPPSSPSASLSALLPQLPLTTTSTAVAALEQQQKDARLLQLLSEHRNRDLLTAAVGRRASLPLADAAASSTASTLQRALFAEHQQRNDQQQQQLLALARVRAEQNFLRAQQQQQAQQQAAQQRQQNDAAIQMALMALASSRNSPTLP